MSKQSQVTVHVRDCRNRCTAFEFNAQPARGRVSGPTAAPQRVCQSGTQAASVQRGAMGPTPP